MTKAELVNLDIADIDFNERECIVYGKGDKEEGVEQHDRNNKNSDLKSRKVLGLQVVGEL